jgi:hypothetical protein
MGAADHFPTADDLYSLNVHFPHGSCHSCRQHRKRDQCLSMLPPLDCFPLPSCPKQCTQPNSRASRTHIPTGPPGGVRTCSEPARSRRSGSTNRAHWPTTRCSGEHMTEYMTSPELAMVHQNRAVGVGVPPKNSMVPDGKTTYRKTDGRGSKVPTQKYTF